jgi:hypothetical protein
MGSNSIVCSLSPSRHSGASPLVSGENFHILHASASTLLRHSGESRNPLWSEQKFFLIQQYGECEKWIDWLLLQPALRAIGYADVRSGILPSQSAFAGMTWRCKRARMQDLEVFCVQQ